MADPISTTKEFNPNGKHLELNLSDGRNTGKFCIPYALLDPAMAKGFLEAYSAITTSGPLSEYVNRIRKGSKVPVYEVTSIFPLKVVGMRSIEFVQRFGSSLSQILQERYSKLSAAFHKLNVEQTSGPNSLVVKSNVSQDFIHLEQKASQKIISDLSRQRLNNVDLFLFVTNRVEKRLLQCQAELRSLINRVSAYVSPYDKTVLIWDILSQGVLKETEISSITANKISTLLFQHWEIILRSLSIYLHMNRNKHDNLHLKPTETIALFDRLQIELEKELENERQGALLLSLLWGIQAPLVSLLREICDLDEPSDIEAHCARLNDFLSESLHQWCDVHLRVDNIEKVIRQWLQRRTEFLGHYLKLWPPSDERASYLTLCDSIMFALTSKDWGEMHRNVSLLVDILQRKRDRYVMSIKAIPGITIRFTSGKMGDEAFRAERCYEFARGLLSNFEAIVADGKLFRAVSEVAYQQIVDNYQLIAQPLKQTEPHGVELVNWAIKLKQQGVFHLFDTLQQLSDSWKAMKGIQQQLLKDHDVKHDLEALLAIIQKEEYSNLLDRYSTIATRLAPFIDRWEEELKKLNQIISNVQSFAFLTLMDPTFPALDLQLLQAQFVLFNRRLKELVQPLTSFFNAFGHLICFDTLSLEAQTKEKVTFQLHLNRAFTLSLFQTSQTVFDKLKTQMQAIKGTKLDPIVEYDEVITTKQTHNASEKASEAASPIQSVRNSKKDLTDQVQGVFRAHTKTKKIMRGLKDLLRDWNIAFSSKFGKGDHNKLYINGVPISLPEHEEWKPGTAKSIQNELILRMQDAIVRKSA